MRQNFWLEQCSYFNTISFLDVLPLVHIKLIGICKFSKNGFGKYITFYRLWLYLPIHLWEGFFNVSGVLKTSRTTLSLLAQYKVLYWMLWRVAMREAMWRCLETWSIIRSFVCGVHANLSAKLLWHFCDPNGYISTCIYELILKECYHYLKIQMKLQNDKADVTINFRKLSGEHPVWIWGKL